MSGLSPRQQQDLEYLVRQLRKAVPGLPERLKLVQDEDVDVIHVLVAYDRGPNAAWEMIGVLPQHRGLGGPVFRSLAGHEIEL